MASGGGGRSRLCPPAVATMPAVALTGRVHPLRDVRVLPVACRQPEPPRQPPPADRVAGPPAQPVVALVRPGRHRGGHGRAPVASFTTGATMVRSGVRRGGGMLSG